MKYNILEALNIITDLMNIDADRITSVGVKTEDRVEWLVAIDGKYTVVNLSEKTVRWP